MYAYFLAFKCIFKCFEFHKNELIAKILHRIFQVSYEKMGHGNFDFCRSMNNFHNLSVWWRHLFYINKTINLMKIFTLPYKSVEFCKYFYLYTYLFYEAKE